MPFTSQDLTVSIRNFFKMYRPLGDIPSEKPGWYIEKPNGKLIYDSPYVKTFINKEKYFPTDYVSHMINSIRARDRKNIQEMQEMQEDYLFRKGAVRLWEYERK